MISGSDESYRVSRELPIGEGDRRMHCASLPFEPRGDGIWRSGKSGRKRALDLGVPVGSAITSLNLLGVFALNGECDRPGAAGATVRILQRSKLVHEWKLRAGDAYTNADDRTVRKISPGDGSELRSVGCVWIDGRMVRLDLLSLEPHPECRFDRLQFAAESSNAEFVLYEVAFGTANPVGCPFRASSGGVALADIASIVRVRDRVRFAQALEQLAGALRSTEDLDEARGEALTFLAVVTAGRLETGAPRELHRIQLEAARRFDALQTLDELIDALQEILHRVAGELMGTETLGLDRQIDRALEILARNFAGRISDESVAKHVGLSTSHFRYLFRSVTGHPFNRYLVGLRLERAKAILEQGALSVTDVASAVGFKNLATFSRAFAHRFGVSPTEHRKGRPAA